MPRSSTDAAIGRVVTNYLGELQAFCRRNLEAARATGRVPRQTDPHELAGHLLGVVLGIRVLTRTGADRPQLEAVARPALRLLDMPRRRAPSRSARS